VKDILQGKPLRHPLHPFLVHFPIGLFTLSLLLDFAARIWPNVSGLREGAYYSMAAGVVMALLAALPGFVDYTDIRRDHPARKIATMHMLLNLLVVGLYAVNLGVRHYESSRNTASWLPLILSLAAFSLLAVSGHLGGKMIFDDGIAVGRHRRKTRCREETLRISAESAAKSPDGFVAIANETDLRDGETLRAEINGTVIAIAKLDGQLFAFQEFCTHRFGPLSEGCLRNGEVECPWHRSRFDMRTGKVTQGPAKENLKTFSTKILDGKIAVQLPASGK
jgi:uncharacterized membrane protein/nitrite reductase/ring-hydroxylating ferredoxin subunit